MKKILYLLPSLLIMAALSGCCANDACNCDDALADALFFKINYTSHRQYDAARKPTSFSARDVDTIRIYRTNRRPTTGNTSGFVQTTEEVTIARRAIPQDNSPGDTIIAPTAITTNTSGGITTLRDQDLIVINNASPFASTSTKLSSYDYRIEIIHNRAPLATYNITNTELAGRYDADGCCTCYQNTGKKYILSYGVFMGTAVDATATDSTGVRRIVRLPFVPR